MPEIAFTKWSPGGNTTIFMPQGGLTHATQAHLARQALDADMLGGEQAGFVDLEKCSLRMAGGEFCCNATRAFGALLTHELGEQSSPWRILSSGWPTPVEVDVMGRAPEYTVTATLELPSSVVVRDIENGLSLVRLPGIDHVLLDATRHRGPAQDNPDEGTALINRLSARLGLERSPCVGAIWWRAAGDNLAMRPLVHVRAVGTSFFESACGSGALALALWCSMQGQGQGQNQRHTQSSYGIDQPSGQALFVDILHNGAGGLRARVSGPVTLLARGTVWLNG